jgi:hypothetical protein
VRLRASLDRYAAPSTHDEGPSAATASAAASSASTTHRRWRRRSSLDQAGAGLDTATTPPPCVAGCAGPLLLPLSDARAREQIATAEALTGRTPHRGFTAAAGAAHVAAQADAARLRRMLSRGAGLALVLHPRVLELPPRGSAVLTLTAVAGAPGRYRDTLSLTQCSDRSSRSSGLGGRATHTKRAASSARSARAGAAASLCVAIDSEVRALPCTAAAVVYACSLDAEAVGCALRLQPHTLGLTLLAPGGQASIRGRADAAGLEGGADFGRLDFGTVRRGAGGADGSSLRRVTVSNDGAVDVMLAWRVLQALPASAAAPSAGGALATAPAAIAPLADERVGCCRAALSIVPASVDEGNGEASGDCSAGLWTADCAPQSCAADACATGGVTVRLSVLPYAGAGSALAQESTLPFAVASASRTTRIAAGSSAVVVFTCTHPVPASSVSAPCSSEAPHPIQPPPDKGASTPPVAPAADGRAIQCSLIADAQWAAAPGSSAAAGECELAAIVLRAVAVLL